MRSSLHTPAYKPLVCWSLAVLVLGVAKPLLAQQVASAPARTDLATVDPQHASRYNLSLKVQKLVNFSDLPELNGPASPASAGPHPVPSHRPGSDFLSLSPIFSPPDEAHGSVPAPLLFNSYVSPSPSITFGGATSDDSGYIPPDSDGAVSANYVVTAVNGALLVQDRSGNRLSLKSLDSFWGNTSDYSYDPTVEYDTFNNRWILTSCAGDNTAHGRILLAVSQTGDPTGNWYIWTTYPNAYFPHVVLSTGSCDWPDFGKIGFNKNWIVIQSNMYQYNPSTQTSSSVGTFVSIFNKASMYSGQGAGSSISYTLYALDKSYGFTQTPAVSNDNSTNALYLLQDWSGDNKQLRLYKVDGSVGSPTFSTVGYPTGSSAWSEGAGSFPHNFAPQAGASNGLDAGNFTIDNAVYRNGYIWGAQAVLVNNKSVIQWWQIGTNNSVIQQGRIDENDNYFRSYPSIAVNKYNNAMIGYSRFSAGEYAGCAYTFNVQGTPQNSVEKEILYKAGQAPYSNGESETDPVTNTAFINYRWGDYSRTMIDPSDDLHFWTIQEYALSNTQWGTWWAHI